LPGLRLVIRNQNLRHFFVSFPPFASGAKPADDPPEAEGLIF